MPTESRRSTFLPCLLCFSLLLLLLGGFLPAQNVNVSGAVVGNGSYATLGAAFAAINAGGQGGANILVDIVNNTNEGTASAVLNQSASPWASLTVRPSGGARTIAGATTSGLPMIDLNGADYVTIDGLNTSGNALTITNTTTAGIGTSTIRLQANATYNVLTRCTILGSSTAGLTSFGGTIWFGISSSGSGSDFNTVSFCDIGPAGPTLPTKAIYAWGNPPYYNNHNSILHCNIYDYFSATAPSAGLYLGTGNWGWTIQYNKFYQTAPRTQTTGAVHAGIQLESGYDGSNTLDNTIGYASANGTGMYTLTGVSTTRFYPIYFTDGSTNVIRGNKITNIAMSGSMSGSGANAPFAAIMGLRHFVSDSMLIGSPTTPGAITYTTTSNALSEIYGLYIASDGGVHARYRIGGIVANCTGSGSIVFVGMRTINAVNSQCNIHWSRIGFPNAPITTNAVGTGTRMIGMWDEIGEALMRHDTVSYMSMSAGNTGTGLSASVVGMLIDAPNTLVQCTVWESFFFALENSHATAATTVAGIVYNGPTTFSFGPNVMARNKIHSLSVGNAASTIYGINALGGYATYENNMIRLGLDANGASLTAGPTIVGLQEAAVTGDQVEHNSIYITGTGVNGTNNTYAFRSLALTNARNFKNNVFFNARSNGAGTGKHYAIQVAGTAPNPVGLSSDNNILRVTGTGGVMGLFNGTDQTSLGNWILATGQDNLSMDLDPNFIAPNGNLLTWDLHVASPTPVEAAGTTVPIYYPTYQIMDIDSQVRSSYTPIDLGADAVNAQSPLVMHVAPLPNSCSTGNRIVTATIVSTLGVPVSGGLQPRIYFRRNGGPLYSTQGVLASGTGYNGSWNFTISAATMGGLSQLDVVSYFIIAQENLGPGPTSWPSAGLVATDVNTVTTPPSSLTTYTILQTLNGTYAVGVGGDFATLTAAVNTYNIGCISGPVVFNLIDASYPSETFPINIGVNAGASAINTLTIKATRPSTLLSGSNVNGILNLYGADYVTIDGSIGNTPNSICPASAGSRDLTIRNSINSTSAAVMWLGATASGDSVTHCAVRNCVITGNTGTTTLIGLGVGGSTINTGGVNSHIQIENNEVKACQHGIYVLGTNVAKTRNTFITQNLISATSPNHVSVNGIYALYAHNLTVSGNGITNMLNTSTSDVCGINLGFVAANGIANNGSGQTDGISNATVTYNNIGSIKHTGTRSAVGIALGEQQSGSSLVANNMVSGVDANGISPDFSAGILLGGGSNPLHVYHNSVWMQGTISGGTTATQVSTCLAVTAASAPANLNVRNNIFHNTQAGNSGATLKFVAVAYRFTAPFTNVHSDYNDLYCSGVGPGTYFTGITGGLSTGTTSATLGSWKINTSGDANSISVVPVFTSTTDLHLPYASNLGLDNLGTPLALVTDDIDCASRSIATPDMGADEFTGGCSAAEGGLVYAVGATTFCGSGVGNFVGTAYSTGGGSTYQWQSSPSGLNTWTNTGGTNPATYTTGVVSVSTDFRLWVSCATNSSVDSSNVVTVTVNPNVTPSVTIGASPGGVICPGTSVVFTATPVNGGTSPSYQWLLNGLNVGANSPTYTNAGLVGGESIACVLGSDALCASPDTALSNVLVMVGDTILPSVNCPGSVVLVACSDTVSYAAPVGSDNCGALTLALTGGLASGSVFPVGTTMNSFQVTDGSGNTATCAFTVTLTAPGMASVAVVDTGACGFGVSCSGALDGMAHVTPGGGCPGYSYLWSSGQTTDTATGLGAGTAFVTVTDGNGATEVLSVVVVEPSALHVSVGTVLSACAGDSTGAADIAVTGGNDCVGYGFLWSNGAGTEDLVNVLPGSYSVTVTDAQGCMAVASVTVPLLPAPVPTILQSGNVLSSGQVWVSYQWLLNGVPIPGATSGSYTATVSGNYSLVVADIQGCEGGSAVVNVTVVGLTQVVGGGFELYPNPATEKLYLRASVALVSVEVYTLLGQRLDIAVDGGCLDVEGLLVGSYLVVARTEEGWVFRRRFVKE